MNFKWDQTKSVSNLKKHDVTFEEASTVFGDPLSLTIPDPIHSTNENRFVTMGFSINSQLLVVIHAETYDNIQIISARKATPKDVEIMKEELEDHEILGEYDFSGGIRGKYSEDYLRGTNVVVLEPDVAKQFPNAKAVNQALRSISALKSRPE